MKNNTVTSRLSNQATSQRRQNGTKNTSVVPARTVSNGQDLTNGIMTAVSQSIREAAQSGMSEDKVLAMGVSTLNAISEVKKVEAIVKGIEMINVNQAGLLEGFAGSFEIEFEIIKETKQ